MQLSIKCFETLPPEAVSLREEVFMREQGFKDEFDNLDGRSLHLVLFADGKPAAVCRIYQEGDVFVFGRLAVKKELRGQHLGLTLLKTAEAEVKARHGQMLKLAAQCQAQGFYAKQGYLPEGTEFFEEHCPHLWMRKILA